MKPERGKRGRCPSIHHRRPQARPADRARGATDPDGHALLEDAPDGGFAANPPRAPGSTARVVRTTEPGERFYGTGERNGAFNLRGRRLVFWNTDAYDADFGGYAPDTDPLYANVPFYVGLRAGRAYGLFTDNSYRLELDLGQHQCRWGYTAEQVLHPSHHARSTA